MSGTEPPSSHASARATVLGYPVEVRQDADGFAVAMPDLPGVEARGNTFSEALYRAEEAGDAAQAAAFAVNPAQLFCPDRFA